MRAIVVVIPTSFNSVSTSGSIALLLSFSLSFLPSSSADFYIYSFVSPSSTHRTKATATSSATLTTTSCRRLITLWRTWPRYIEIGGVADEQCERGSHFRDRSPIVCDDDTDDNNDDDTDDDNDDDNDNDKRMMG